MDEMFRFFVHIATQQEPVVTYTITTNVTNGSYSGATSIVAGSTATVTISAYAGYALPSSVTVTNASYTYDDNTGQIILSNPTGNITITAQCAREYTIHTTVTNGNYFGDTRIVAGSTAVVSITANGGFVYPSNNDVNVSGASYSYNSNTGKITLSNPTSEVYIYAYCAYTIATTVTNGTYSGATRIAPTRAAQVTISANSGYDLPESITVTNASYTYNSSTGVIGLNSPTGKVTITAVCQSGAIDVPFVQPVLSDNGTMGGNDFAVTATASTNSAYKAFDNDSSTYWSVSPTGYSDVSFYNPNALKVSSLKFTWYSSSTSYVGKTIIVYGSNDNSTWTELVTSEYVSGATRTVTVDSSAYYTYHKVSIERYSTSTFVTMRLVQLDITAVYRTSVSTYSITTNITGGTYSGATSIITGTTANVTLTANSGVYLPSTISVTNASYTYDRNTGLVVLSSPTGNIVITAQCVGEQTFTRPDLSANGTMGGNAFAVTATANTSNAYIAVDGNTATSSYWSGTTGSGASTDYLFYNPNALKVSSLVCKWSSSTTTYIADSIIVYGSNDNSTWTQIASSSYVSGATRTVTVNSSSFYTYHKLTMKNKGTKSNAAIRLVELTINATYI